MCSKTNWKLKHLKLLKALMWKCAMASILKTFLCILGARYVQCNVLCLHTSSLFGHTTLKKKLTLSLRHHTVEQFP